MPKAQALVFKYSDNDFATLTGFEISFSQVLIIILTLNSVAGIALLEFPGACKCIHVLHEKYAAEEFTREHISNLLGEPCCD